MPRDVAFILEDIADAIAHIEDATRGHDLPSFAADWLLRRGVERGLEIISEASRRIPDEMLATEPALDWKAIRGIGNILRHEYHTVAPDIVWAVVTDHLAGLAAAIARMRGAAGAKPQS